MTEKITKITKEYGVYDIAKFLLDDPRFSLWSGSSKPHQHHYGKGGLAKHTLEVIELCLRTNDYYNNIVNSQHIILAALFHDSGKMFDYIPKDDTYQDWSKGTHARQIHHVSKSAIIWHDAVKSSKLFEDDEEIITHAILSHHGLREWGSPVAPATKLAWMLHLNDGISARIDDCDKYDRF